MPLETEAKIRINIREYKQILKLIGLEPVLQINSFYRIGENIVRVREEGNKKIVCIKGKPKVGRYNSREEDEFQFDGNRFFDCLKVEPFFSYEKRRAERKDESCTVCLDDIGKGRYYLEVEGKKDDITKVLKRFGLEERAIERRSYWQILYDKKDGMHRENI